MKGRAVICLGIAMLTAACGPAEKRWPAMQMPAPPPPALQPLPLPPFDTLARSQQIPVPDAVDWLVLKVDQLYGAGMEDYRQGNLEKAKEEFDHALALLLQSNLDVQGDDRLSAEFNKVVENVYAAEAAALERGDTLNTHRYEPAPIETFAGLTFPVDPKVKERAQEELKSVRSDLPLVSNDYVAGVMTYLQERGSGYMRTILQRVGLYRDVIEAALGKEQLPQDLIYLAAAESAFNPFAVSRAGARGIWQFIRGTASLYGLKRDRWVDERQDPVKSSQAAARHLKDLYQMFGDWYLAMAAYDSGALTVQRAIEKTGYADYWELRRLHALPVETENYVPIFLATALIAKDPHAYRLDVQPDPRLECDQVVVPYPTDLRSVAQLIDHPVEDVLKLNPSLLRWTTPANDPEFILRLPPGTKQTFEQNIASIPPNKRIWWRAHRVEPGETVASIARKFRISPAALAQVNQVSRDTPLEEGAHLVVPLAAGKESSLARSRPGGARRAVWYRVRSGDTLEFIADRFDVSPYEIRRWNHLKTSALTPGKSLRLYVAGSGLSARGSLSRRRAKSRHASSSKVAARSSKAPSRQKKVLRGTTAPGR